MKINSQHVSGAALLALLAIPAHSEQGSVSIESLEQRRLVLMRETIDNLAHGKISPDEAQQIGTDLSNVLALQSKLNSDKELSPEYLTGLNRSLDRTSERLNSLKRNKKIWRGIDPHDTALDRKIGDALSSGRVSKEEAAGLQREGDSLKARETAAFESDSSNLSEVMAIANDEQALEAKLDGKAKRSR